MMAMGRIFSESLLFHTVFWLCGEPSSKKGGNTHFFVRGGRSTLPQIEEVSAYLWWGDSVSRPS